MGLLPLPLGAEILLLHSRAGLTSRDCCYKDVCIVCLLSEVSQSDYTMTKLVGSSHGLSAN